MAESNYDLVDLHKNVVDEITLVSASGKPMKRSDLIDVWFDSGSMPMHNGIILEKKTKLTKTKIFQLILLRKVSIKRVGFIPTRYWNLSF
jgi:isoleucyl-tRNA synthetase